MPFRFDSQCIVWFGLLFIVCLKNVNTIGHPVFHQNLQTFKSDLQAWDFQNLNFKVKSARKHNEWPFKGDRVNLSSIGG